MWWERPEGNKFILLYFSYADKVREKAFYALSCITRGNEKALEELNLNDGFSTIIRAMQSENSKLKIKVLFFIKALCTDDSKYAK